MPYVPKELAEKLKQIDLITYFQMTGAFQVIYEGNGRYSTKEHHSLKMDNGKWNWFSHGVGGRNAVDFLCKIETGKDYHKALELLMKRTGICAENYQQVTKNNEEKYKDFNNKWREDSSKPKQIILPEKNENNKRAFAYLMSRGIDKEVINYCIDNHFLYEDKEHHNVIFLGYDENNEVKFGCARASNQTRFMMDLRGSSKEYSFRLLAKEKSSGVHIFESAIDLLSYATLIKNRGMDFRNFNLVSLSGVYQTASNIGESKVPVAIKKLLEAHKEINTIILHLDNDIAGRNATEAFKIKLEKDYKILDRPSTFGKDVNDFLRHQIEEKNKKSRAYER